MPTLYTPLLGFSLPTQGELSGTWGDVTNTSLTNLADTAIAGTTTLSSDADVTLTATVGAANQARSAVLLCTGTRTALRNITAPASSKKYTVINNTVGGFAVVIRGSGPTAGITVPWGAVVEVVWYGTDFIAVGAPATGITGAVAIANGGTGQTTAAAALAALGGAPLASPTFTGTVTIPSGASIAGYVQANSPAFTGTPTAPTAAVATSNTQLATTQFVKDVFGTVPAGALPTPVGQAGKFLQVNSGESGVQWSFAGISQVTTATTATTLTNTPTLLQITPASYGVTVTLPDATTCSLGGPLHCIDNQGAYPVRVCDSTGALKGFIFAGVVSYISLDNNSTAAGQWAISSNELVGASAQLLTTNALNIVSCIALDANREILITGGSTSVFHGIVYDKSTNTFGTPTLIRGGSVNGVYSAAVLSGANQVLVVSCQLATTAFEAVTLTISGTTITVNTAATATLAANLNNLSTDCGIVAAGSSFIIGYNITGVFYELRAMTISGTTVTIGAAVRQTSQNNSAVFQVKYSYPGSGSVIMVASDSHGGAGGTGNIYVTPYTVSGSTLTVGTQVVFTTGVANQSEVQKFVLLGSGRWYISFSVANGGTNYDGIVSLSGTTATMSTVSRTTAAIQDAIILSSTKVLVLNNQSSNNANILTDTAGTASAGTAITLDNGTARSCLYVTGTDVVVASNTTMNIFTVDCSGASPVRSFGRSLGVDAAGYGSGIQNRTSDSVLRRSNFILLSGTTAELITNGSTTVANRLSVKDGFAVSRSSPRLVAAGHTGTANPYRGKADSERWVADAVSVITKLEAAV